MKNLEEIPSRTIPSFRVPIQGARPLSGWALQYVGTEENDNIKHGYWLATYEPNADLTSAVIRYAPNVEMIFHDEAHAKVVAAALLKHTDLQNNVMRIG